MITANFARARSADLNVTVLGLSQLSREAEEREPRLSADLRESGDLEQDARVVLFLDAPHRRNSAELKCGLSVTVAKATLGAAGEKVPLHFNHLTGEIASSDSCWHCEHTRERA